MTAVPTCTRPSELQWAVGLNLGEFLLPYSSLSARYGSYTGTNVDWLSLSEGDANIADGGRFQ